jgi:hypothetical protein
VDFFLQDPLFQKSYTIHEALLKACEGANYGGGAYAFVSIEGVKLFIEDEAFVKLIQNGGFKLIVGVDEITSEKVLVRLGEIRQQYADRLHIYAFLHDTKGSLFHPKFSWFKKENGGVLVLGSGNLTGKGLRLNREAFSYIEVDQAKIQEIENYWNEWLDHNSKYLLPIDDEKVLKKAKTNAKIYSRLKRNLEAVSDIQETEKLIEETPIFQSYEDEDIYAWTFSDDAAVLVAEIPRSGNRWKQANFDKSSFENFFGAQPGVNGHHRILLRNVSSNGNLATEIEVRPSVSVASHNWRFELEAASGIPYPDDGRPIAIFVRVSTRTFLYQLLLPGDTHYIEVLQFLNNNNPDTSRVRRQQTNVYNLKTECPNLPLWSVYRES